MLMDAGYSPTLGIWAGGGHVEMRLSRAGRRDDDLPVNYLHHLLDFDDLLDDFRLGRATGHCQRQDKRRARANIR